MSKILDAYQHRRGSLDARTNPEEKRRLDAEEANKNDVRESLKKTLHGSTPNEKAVNAIAGMLREGGPRTVGAGSRIEPGVIPYNPVPLSLIAMPHDNQTMKPVEKAPIVDNEEIRDYTDEELTELAEYYLSLENEDEQDEILELFENSADLNRFSELVDAITQE